MAHKIRKAMAEWDGNYKLAGLVKIDGAYIGGRKRRSDKASEKTPVSATISSEENGLIKIISRKPGLGNGRHF